MTTKTDKIRSVLLTLLMVVSVFGGSVAFAGSVAANHSGTDADAHLNSGATYWAGMELHINASTATINGDWELRPVEDGTTGNIDQVIQFGNDNNATVDTSDLDGDYVIVNSTGYYVEFSSGTPNVTGTHSDTDVPPGISFEVAPQNLNAALDPASTVDAGTDTSIVLSSNRGTGGYDVAVSSGDLSLSQLENVVDEPIKATDSDNGLVIVDQSNANPGISLDTTAVDPGTYNFTVMAADTGASAQVTLTTQEAGDMVARFSSGVVSENVGDVAAITVDLSNTQDANFSIGGPGVNYQVNGHVVDGDEDGQATIMLNTYATGRNGQTGLSAAGDDTVDWSDVHIPVSGSPIEGGDYTMNVTATSGEDDVGTLVLNERSTDGISTWTASPGATINDRASLLDAMKDDSSVALQDRLVVQVQATGIYGYVNDSYNLSQGSNSSNAHGAYLTITQTNEGANSNPKVLNVSNTSNTFYDGANDTFYLVYDTSEDLGATLANGDQYEAEFVVYENNSYIPNADATESVTGEFNIDARSASFNGLNADGTLEVEQGEEVTVSGTSSVAAGSELQVRLRATGNNPFLKATSVEVADDGSWEATFDTSDTEIDTEFTATVRSSTGGVISDEVGGVVVEDTGTPTPTPTTTATPTPTPTPTPEPTTTMPPTDTPTDEPTPTATPEDGQPGFGIVVALLAMLGAALLAARRFE